MYKILINKQINSQTNFMKLDAPLIANKALPGQFVIIRIDEHGERIPFTIAEINKKEGSIAIIYQVVGASTMLLAAKKEGEYVRDLVGPLGRPTELDGYKKVAVIGGGLGCAIAYPQAKYLFDKGAEVHTIVGFRQKDLIILENELKACSQKTFIYTDDGSNENKGLVTDGLRKLLESGENYDLVIAIGPPVMMKYVSLLTKEYGIKTIVSLNPIMIDGTGMCGCCRVTVDGKTRFACVEGPDFDGHLVDFDELIRRNNMYREEENRARESTCNLLKLGGEK